METEMSDELPTLKITKADLNDRNEYIGATDVSDYAGHIEIDADLGWVKFAASIVAKGRIRSLAGSGIKAGSGVKAGYDIKAGWGIEAGSGVKAGYDIKAGYGVKAGDGIEAGSGIKAGSSIESGSGIEAGSGIKAGDGIESGSGIEAGLSITAKWLSARLRIFAGACAHRLPTPKDMEIRAEVRSGIVAFGTVVAPVGDAENSDA